MVNERVRGVPQSGGSAPNTQTEHEGSEWSWLNGTSAGDLGW